MEYGVILFKTQHINWDRGKTLLSATR